jgi:hypothetical protein
VYVMWATKYRANVPDSANVTISVICGFLTCLSLNGAYGSVRVVLSIVLFF